jgi:GNAT superfamily N-acetyltransferase
VRAAAPSDVEGMVALAEERRAAYEPHQPTFWRRAPDAAAVHAAYLARRLRAADAIARVAEDPRTGALVGFAIGVLAEAPPVYAPGGLTCTVDDLAVDGAERWESAGRLLLDDVVRSAKDRGAVQVVVVCGAQDAPKRRLLEAIGLSPASAWYVGTL